MNERSIFLEALAKDAPAQRSAYLGEACGGDAALRRRVEALLTSHEQAGSFLGKPVPERLAEGLAGQEGSPETQDETPGGGQSRTPGPRATVDAPAVAERPGGVIGPYQLLEQIGEGGMGTVWMAEQTHPVQRKVALKLIKSGMDSRQVIARFEAERQALALMDHPNIARVLDAGTTDRRASVPACSAAASTSEDACATGYGRPYFVMELVHGIPITKYCDEHHLTPRERLELFVPVCQAVQHAHQKGIIHRDIKPSNVMVCLYDGKPVPKVIDFGIAKATGSRLTDKTLFTEIGQIVGTLEYMSPEQAELNQLDIDTRSDIYSLGVLLYELLTGTTPLERKRFKEVAFLEVLRLIREEESPRPSTRLSELSRSGEPSRTDGALGPARLAGPTSSLASIAANRGVEPKKLSGLLRGELDWIVMKTLEKDRNRLYETANGLAMDVQRYLADEPVQACPPTLGYKLRKFVRRNRGPVLAAALVLLALIGGIIGTTWQAVRATWAEEEAIAQRDEKDEARREAVKERDDKETARAQAAAAAEEARKAKEAETVQRKLADKRRAEAEAARKDEATERARADTEKRIAQTVRDFLQYKLLRQADASEQADALLRAGASLDEAKENPTIRELLDRAARELAPDKIESQFPDQPLVQAEILQTVGDTYNSIGEFGPAVAHLTRALHLRQRQLGPDHADTLTTLNKVAVACAQAGQLPEAIHLFEQVRDKRTEKLGPDHPDTLIALNNVAAANLLAGNYREAIRLYEPVRDKMVEKLGLDDGTTLTAQHGLAMAYRKVGRLPEAIKLHEQARDIEVDKFGADHPFTLATLHELACVYRDAGKVPQAVRLFEQVRDKQVAKLGPDHPRTLGTLSNLAEMYLGHQDAGKLPETILLFEQLRDRATKKLGPDHPETLTLLHNLASAYKYAERLPEAIELYEQVRDKRALKLGPDHPDTLTTLNNLAGAYQAVGRLAEAVRLFERVRDKRTESFGPDHPSTLNTLHQLAGAYLAGRKLPEAIRLYKQVGEKRALALGPDHPDTLTALGNLAGAYMNAGKLPEAISLYEQVRDTEVEKLGPDHPSTLMTLNNLAVAYWQMRRLNLSIPLFEKVLREREIKLGPEHPDTLATAFSLAINYRDAERLTEAAKVIDQWLPRVIAKLGLGHPTSQYGVNAALSTYERAGTPAQAEPLLRELAEYWKQKAGADSPQHAGQLSALCMNLLQQNKPAEAEPVLRQCLAIREKTGPEAWTTFHTQSLLGASLMGQKKYPDAEPLLLQGYEGMKQREARIPANAKIRLIEALERLVKLYDATGPKEKAALWRKKLGPAQLAHELWQDLLTGKEARHRFTESKHEGALTAGKGKQVHPLEMKGGRTYVLDLQSKAFDSFLILEDADGSRLGENDDISPANLNSRMIYTAETTATYRILATAFTSGATGPYVLRIRELVLEK